MATSPCQTASAEKTSGSSKPSSLLMTSIAAVYSDVQRKWCEIPSVSRDEFCAFVSERIPDDVPLDETLRKMRFDDLYFACACLRGDAKALAVFHSRYLPEVETAVARMQNSGVAPDDVKEVLCQKLLLPDGDRPARLTRYAGRGDLRSWLRVTATRTALDLMRSNRTQKRESLDDSALFDHLTACEDDQELQYLKQLYRQEFRSAFEKALATLSARERNLLRLQLLDGLNIDQVGALYRVHRATVARWNCKVRERLLGATRRTLLGRLHIDRDEFESIVRMIGSRFDVSICRHLGEKMSADASRMTPAA